MDTTLTKDARGFVEGVVSYLRKDNRSKSSLPKVRAYLGKVTAQAKKQKVARIETAVALTENEKSSIELVLSNYVGHEIHVECTVKTDVLGGFFIRVGDWIVDTTLKSQLNEMANVLIQ